VAGSGAVTDAGSPEHPQYGRYVRTGELARWRADGVLEVLGPVGRRAVVGGSEIDLGEVEAVFLGHASVHAAAVVATEDPAEQEAGAVLTAFVETEGETGTAERLHDHARSALRAAVVPREIVVLDALPRNERGTVDHDALVDLAENSGGQADGALDERLVAELLTLWTRLLRSVEVDAQTNFFAGGGHSLLAAKLVQDIDELTGVRLELSEVFAHPTPAALAGHLGAMGVGVKEAS
jgi:hypothetical protein